MAKTAIVTGASRGIGREIAKRLVERLGEPLDIARIVSFLAEPDAG